MYIVLHNSDYTILSDYTRWIPDNTHPLPLHHYTHHLFQHIPNRLHNLHNFRHPYTDHRCPAKVNKPFRWVVMFRHTIRLHSNPGWYTHFRQIHKNYHRYLLHITDLFRAWFTLHYKSCLPLEFDRHRFFHTTLFWFAIPIRHTLC